MARRRHKGRGWAKEAAVRSLSRRLVAAPTRRGARIRRRSRRCGAVAEASTAEHINLRRSIKRTFGPFNDYVASKTKDAIRLVLRDS